MLIYGQEPQADQARPARSRRGAGSVLAPAEAEGRHYWWPLAEDDSSSPTPAGRGWWGYLSGATSPYSAVEVYRSSATAFSTLTGGYSVTSKVYEVNSIAGLAGKVAWIEPTETAGEWRTRFRRKHSGRWCHDPLRRAPCPVLSQGTSRHRSFGSFTVPTPARAIRASRTWSASVPTPWAMTRPGADRGHPGRLRVAGLDRDGIQGLVRYVVRGRDLPDSVCDVLRFVLQFADRVYHYDGRADLHVGLTTSARRPATTSARPRRQPPPEYAVRNSSPVPRGPGHHAPRRRHFPGPSWPTATPRRCAASRSAEIYRARSPRCRIGPRRPRGRGRAPRPRREGRGARQGDRRACRGRFPRDARSRRQGAIGHL